MSQSRGKVSIVESPCGGGGEEVRELKLNISDIPCSQCLKCGLHYWQDSYINVLVTDCA